MAGFKNKLGLSIESTVRGSPWDSVKPFSDIAQPRTHKKYLGEPDDPHFLPHSPIIGRQQFTEQEEGELKRTCALALSQIPHSDDMTDDPFKYLASHIQQQSAPAAAKPTAAPLLPKNTQAKQAPPQPAPFLSDPVDTATPSESSKRDTFDRTDYSTPLTSAGITPGETTKRFSDAVRRPSTSKGSSNLKYESSQKSKSRAASSSRGVSRKSADAGVRKTHDRKPSKDGNNAAKKTIKVVQQTPRPSDAQAQAAEIARPVRFSQLELNKKLPPLPRSVTEPIEKPSVTRFMKTIKKKKSQVIEGRSMSASAASSPMPPIVSKFNGAATRPLSQTPAIPPAEQKQRKFKFGKFFGGRKDSPAPVAVS